MAAEKVDIVVTLKDAAKAGARSVKSGITGIGTAATKTKGILKSMQSQLLAATSLFAGGAIIGNAIKIFTEFDDVMRQVGAVTGATAKQMEALTAIAEDMGRTTRFSASEAADGLRLLGMAGFEAEEAIQALPGVLNLAAAGSLQLSDAADITTNILAGFGLEIEKLGQVNDVLVKTFTSSNTTLIEIGESFKLVGPIAKGVGANFEDLLASIGKLGDAGLKGTLAGTALKGALDALFTPTADESKLMAELAGRIGQTSLNIRDASGNFIGFAEIISQLERAGLRGEEALRLFGLRAGPGMAALLEAGSDSLKGLKDGLDDAGGTAQRIAEEMEAGIGGSTRELIAVFEAVKIAGTNAFGADLIAIIDRLRDAIGELVGEIKALDQDGTLKEWGLRIQAVMVGVEISFRTLILLLKNAYRASRAFAKASRGDFAGAKEELDKLTESWKEYGTEVGEIFKEDPTSKVFFQIDKQTGKVKEVLDNTGKVLQDYGKPSGPIGTGASAIAAAFQKSLFEIDTAYKNNLINLNEYYNQRKELIVKRAQEEIALLKAKAQAESDVGKRKDIESNILIKQIQLQKALAQLEVDRENKVKIAAKARIDEQEKILKSSLIETRAVLDFESKVIEGAYAQNLVTIDEYYAERARIVEKRINAEIAVIQNALDQTTDDGKRSLLSAQIFSKQKELETNLLGLKNKRYKEEERLQTEELKSQEKVNSLKLRAEGAYADQVQRLKQFDSTEALSSKFQEELITLQQKHASELEEIQNYNQAKLEQMRQHGMNEAQVKLELDEQARMVEEQQELQRQEKQELAIQQSTRLKEQEINNLKTLAGGTASLFGSLYDIMGQKNKEFFYISKAAAIASATISAYVAANKAMEKGGILAKIQAALILAQALANVTRIKSQSLAEGGPVLGNSPTPTSDDKLIHATSGEFMHPVSSVKYYGMDIMDGIRRKAFPKEMFSGYKSPGVKYGSNMFAAGGAVTGSGGVDTETIAAAAEPNIINILDPDLLSSYLASSDGEKQVLNIIRQNPDIVKGAT